MYTTIYTPTSILNKVIVLRVNAIKKSDVIAKYIYSSIE